MRLTFLLLFVFPYLATCQQQQPCAPRDYGYSSFVCVCNATYCDDLPRPVLVPEGQYLLYTSDKAASRFLKTEGFFAGRAEGPSVRGVEYILDPTTTYQSLMGFGGSFTDSAAIIILSLSTPAQDNLLSSYFSPTGLEYNLGRLNMGGCDFSTRTYTYVETEGDVELTTFALQPEDLNYKIPIIKRAQEMSSVPIKLVASPWTAPPWMKTNNDYIGYGQLLPEMYQPWANYFVKFLDSYAAQNVSIWALTAQNEPIDGNVPGFTFNCMGWTAVQQKKWVEENLGPTLAATGYDDVLLMIMDDQRYNLPGWAEKVLNNGTAAQYVDGIAVHWYGDQISAPDRLNQTHHLFPDFFILGTEACEGDTPLEQEVIMGSWERLENYAHDILVDVNHWVTGWIDWNLALNMTGGPNWAGNFVDSPILVSQENDEFYKNPMFYAMGHFSKFVKAGAVRVALTSPDPGSLDSAAFLNPDGTTVIIILNRSEVEELVTVQVPERGTLPLTLGPRSLHTVLFQ
ncbi:hypothetical protein Pcinc_023572 [Petrolisthes cinctipes]|uniref:Glucosylceramidase n=1 Tax=Petrolisthes cinctipes TaxID=88211 RepID=A0AAE1FC91_PETCI|nr:hypothetical protein Pcinc_023572 [Petrolisthes cinctipes]